jgi:hypothetical protein
VVGAGSWDVACDRTDAPNRVARLERLAVVETDGISGIGDGTIVKG